MLQTLYEKFTDHIGFYKMKLEIHVNQHLALPQYGYGHWIYGQISYMAIDHLVLTGILDVKIVEMFKACKQDVAQEMEGN